MIPITVGALKMSGFISQPSVDAFLKLEGVKQNVVEDLKDLGLPMREIEVMEGSE
jgi:hypothetical protein